MARYIDAEKLEEGVFPEVTNWYQEGWNDALRGAMLAIPTADVAPRAEVEELIYRLECLLCHATGGRLSKHTYDLLTMETAVTDYLDESYCEGKEEGYKNAKAEVAREIFEEIRKRAYSERGFFVVNFDIDDFIAELKKKYTGG